MRLGDDVEGRGSVLVAAIGAARADMDERLLGVERRVVDAAGRRPVGRIRAVLETAALDALAEEARLHAEARRIGVGKLQAERAAGPQRHGEGILHEVVEIVARQVVEAIGLVLVAEPQQQTLGEIALDEGVGDRHRAAVVGIGGRRGIDFEFVAPVAEHLAIDVHAGPADLRAVAHRHDLAVAVVDQIGVGLQPAADAHRKLPVGALHLELVGLELRHGIGLRRDRIDLRRVLFHGVDLRVALGDFALQRLEFALQRSET